MIKISQIRWLSAVSVGSLVVVRGDDGSLKIMANDPSVAAALEAAEIVMAADRYLLAALHERTRLSSLRRRHHHPRPTDFKTWWRGELAQQSAA